MTATPLLRLLDHLAAGRAAPSFALRARTCYVPSLAWWAKFARLAYEVDHGLDEPRLVQRPPGWRESPPSQYRRTLQRVRQAPAGLCGRRVERSR